MKTKIIAMAVLLSLAAGAAIGYDAKGGAASLEQRLARIEKAIERLEARVSDHGGGGMMHGGMMEGCPMMGGGMMGGGSPNEQWRSRERSR